MHNKPYVLEERLVDFAGEVALFCKTMPSDFTGQYDGQQLLRSAGSSALNFGEMQGAQRLKDFKNKATISLKELKESRINLKILSKIQYGKNSERAQLLDEVEQLIKILATIIKNKK